jgi:pSer/pThr/pTyr-binding forkhead associated (FHA) protein
MKPGDPSPPDASARRHATVLESVEEIRALIRGATVREAAPSTIHAPVLGAGEAPAADSPAEPFRPVDRPPMALLTVLDDGDESGELIRLRASTFRIGRVECDLVIPHDGGMSARHAEISRRLEAGVHRWYLRDLQSTNGTFARASSVVLHNGQELLIGRTRLRFELQAPGAAPAPPQAEPLATRKWQAAPAPAPAPALQAARPMLVELTVAGEGRRFPLSEPETWIGRDPSCRVTLNDPTVDLKHARAARDAKGRWVLTNARSINGVWARVDEVALERGGQFQCGEQRFLVKVL